MLKEGFIVPKKIVIFSILLLGILLNLNNIIIVVMQIIRTIKRIIIEAFISFTFFINLTKVYSTIEYNLSCDYVM